jgi:hypothetical protein
LGKTNKYWAWANPDHIHAPNGKHPDWYIVSGTVSYTKAGAVNRLATEDVLVGAIHGGAPTEWPDEPRGAVTVTTNVRFDAELGLLSFLPGHVTGGVPASDPITTAWMQPMNFHFSGQDEPGKWVFQGGHFGLSTPAGEIGIEGELGEMFVYDVGWGDSGGVLNRGGAVDASQGASPWMNDFGAALNASIDGTRFHPQEGPIVDPPRVQWNAYDEMMLLSSQFTRSTDWMPTQLEILPANVISPATPVGDINRDGVVDEQDYDLWRAKYGTHDDGDDVNGDGIYDAADYTAWRKFKDPHLAVAGGSHPGDHGIAVPEPAMAALVLIGFCLAMSGYRSRPL